MTLTRTTAIEPLQELHVRESNGIAVALLWDPSDDAVYIDVSDARTLEQLRFAVLPEQALDAYHHPLAHAAAQRLLGVPHLSTCVRDDEALL